MFTKEELSKIYKKFDDDKIEQIATSESKGLREEAVPILELEIKRRNLDKNLLEWISFERNFYEGSELSMLKNIVKNSKCSECGRKNCNVKGFNINYHSLFGCRFHADLIICETCGKKLRKSAYLKTATLGWISQSGIFAVPFYFIDELFSVFKRNKRSEEIIETFIFENTGLLRKNGIETVENLISKSNKLKIENGSSAI